MGVFQKFGTLAAASAGAGGAAGIALLSGANACGVAIASSLVAASVALIWHHFRASPALMRCSLDSTDQGLLALDTRGRCVFCNRASIGLLDVRSAQDLLDHDIVKVFDMATLAAPVCAELQATMAAVRAGTTASQRVVATIQRRLGPPIDVEIGVRALTWRRGRVGLLISLVDVTERQRAADQRELLEAQFWQAQKMESLGVLAGGIAHDFNNLLVGVLGNADAALTELGQNSPVRGRIESVVKNAERASELIKQLLAYTGGAKRASEPIDLVELARDMLHLLEVTASKNLRLEFSASDDAVYVEGDSSQLCQVVMNLLRNAADAVGNAAGRVTVRVGVTTVDPQRAKILHPAEALEPGSYCFVRVEDSGVGMDRATQNRMFDPFFTTKQQGKGLGLSAVLGIVAGHRGAVRVSSAAGAGTVFEVLLPMLQRSSTESHGVLIPAPRTAVSHEPDSLQRGRVILVVDDEPAVREFATGVLRKAGFTVLHADDGVRALEYYEHEHARLSAVLLDLTMPVMGGSEALARMRCIDDSVPVVVSSGFDEHSVRGTGAEWVADGFLQKPYRSAELLQAIDRAIVAAPIMREPPRT